VGALRPSTARWRLFGPHLPHELARAHRHAFARISTVADRARVLTLCGHLDRVDQIGEALECFAPALFGRGGFAPRRGLRTVSFSCRPRRRTSQSSASSWPGEVVQIAVKTMPLPDDLAVHAVERIVLAVGPRITKRYVPPGRKSISQPGSVKPLAPTTCRCVPLCPQLSKELARSVETRVGSSPLCFSLDEILQRSAYDLRPAFHEFFLANAGSFGRSRGPRASRLTSSSSLARTARRSPNESPA